MSTLSVFPPPDRRGSESESSETESSEFAEEEEVEAIKWVHIIFLPFESWWQILMLFVVCIKCILGPLTKVFPMFECWDVAEKSDIMFYVKLAFSAANPIYLIDTFLYIVHRQVQEEAMKQAYMPKRALYLFLDVVSVLPIYDVLADERCNSPTMFPNIFGFTEFAIVYRIADYFALTVSHNVYNLVFGYFILYLITLHAFACFHLLWTFHGYCPNCNLANKFDWRGAYYSRIKESNYSNVVLYGYAFSYVQSFLMNKLPDELIPLTYSGFFLLSAFILIGYANFIYVLNPKCFSETKLRLKRLLVFHPRVKRIIEETQRRNPSQLAYKDVEKYFSLVWTKSSGIISMPDAMLILPRYLAEDIQQDLIWPFFYHSPTFRKTSESYKRWVGRHVRIIYKQPNERFFIGLHCYSSTYYVKSGIVQLVSSDDSVAPLISMTSGTIFGDISFFVPPVNRKVNVRCLTYCEVFLITRKSLLESLHKFPEDRRLIMNLVEERLKHAKALYKCKEIVKEFDRTEDEGIHWIKQRWWEIARAIKYHKTVTKDKKKLVIPPEEKNYHCPKYIGQLVLCEEIKLQKKTMFMKLEFPWILSPDSLFINFWGKITVITVYSVILICPPNFVNKTKPWWFYYYIVYCDIIFTLDILVGLFTGSFEDKNEVRFISLLIKRLKNKFFMLDILSTRLIPILMSFTKNDRLIPYAQFCRMFKAYMIFANKHNIQYWHKKMQPVFEVSAIVMKLYFLYFFITPYMFFIYAQSEDALISESYYFGKICLPSLRKENKDCVSDMKTYGYFGLIAIALSWLLYYVLPITSPVKIADSLVMVPLLICICIMELFLRFRYIATLYLKYGIVTNYQFFVTKLKSHYIRLKIHPDLLKRLTRYLECHWRYYNGIDIIQPQILKDEPYDVYWKLHGEIAEKTIAGSPAFQNASLAFVRELAQNVKFLILPKGTTLIMFGSQIENVTWLIKGTVKVEYQSDDDKIVTKTIRIGNSLALLTILLARAALRTFTASSDIEVLYMKVADFFAILRKYPDEHAFMKQVQFEIKPLFDRMFIAYVKKHKSYQKKLRQEIFHANSETEIGTLAAEEKPDELQIPVYFKDFRRNPESSLMMHWLLIRAIVVFLQLIAKVLILFTSQEFMGPILDPVLAICRMFCICDIIIKLFLPYYDHRGLIITQKRKCALNYMTRGFAADVLGLVFSWNSVIKVLVQVSNYQTLLLLGNLSTLFHFYLLTGYLNYLADRPIASTIYIKIAAWQIALFLFCCYVWGVAMLLCLSFPTEEEGINQNTKLNKQCWMPNFHNFHNITNVGSHQIFLIQVSAFHFAQASSMAIPAGMLDYSDVLFEVFIINVVLRTMFWIQSNYCKTFLLLLFRGETAFQHGVNQLRKFLKEERVDSKTIERSMNYFEYWWKRTAGVDMKVLMNERIGAVFRQDLHYYFFRKTLQITDKLLRGGELLERTLARSITESYFLPNEEIIRQKHLSPHIYIVHRGRVSIRRDDEEVTIVGKGSMFGQLEGYHLRPMRITVQAIEFTDVLMIPVTKFQTMITDDVKEKIAENGQSKFDFLSLKKTVSENPYNSVQYLLRGAKVIKLPSMANPVMSDTSKWYARWLLLVWVVGPIISIGCVVFLLSMPKKVGHTTDNYIFWTIIAFDVLHILHLFIDFFSMELRVVQNMCVYKYTRLKKLFQWTLYADLMSLLIPLWTLYDDQWKFQIARLLRFHSPVLYYKLFCKSFKDQTRAILLKISLIVLLIHSLTCGWIISACRLEDDEKFPISLNTLTSNTERHIDMSLWAYADSGRIGGGCARVSSSFYKRTQHNKSEKFVSFLVPRDWRMDYMIALFYILTILTGTNIEITIPMTVQQYTYKIFANYVIYYIDLWICSMVMSAIYTKYQELYKFEYELKELLLYLKLNGVSKYLIQAIKTYFNLLWQKQRGCWLPSLTNHAPLTLREDIMSALYMHHLLTPSLFRKLPKYFLKQICVRFKRVIYFPGKFIIKEGNIRPVMFFIHEGEVEKWYIDKDGDNRLSSVLTMNNFFGIIPGLFPNTPYQYSFYTRTVADLVYLEYKDWQDILNAYPELKYELYMGAMKMKRERLKHVASGSSVKSDPNNPGD